MLEISVCI